MILIDENIPEGARLALRRWKPFQVGHDFWNKGIQDDQIANRLRTLRQTTFFTLDRDFWANRRIYGHPKVSVVFVDAHLSVFATLVDRFLRHRQFRTHASRMGRMMKINESSIVAWRSADGSRVEMNW